MSRPSAAAAQQRAGYPAASGQGRSIGNSAANRIRNPFNEPRPSKRGAFQQPARPGRAAREILGVVGGSGTGKSVLLRSVVGLQKPHSGVVRIGGATYCNLARARMERRFGILFQKGALYSSLTVLENVALPLIEHVGLARPLAERLAKASWAWWGCLPERETSIRPRCPEAW